MVAVVHTLNHFKTDQANFIRRETHDLLQKEVDMLRLGVTKLETRSITWTTAVALFFLLVQIALKFIR